MDIARDASETDLLALRIVLLGPGTTNRWTSAEPEIIPNDGIFRRVRFSILEADLVRVQGTASYDATVADINRIMFRHNPGPPSASGTPLDGIALLDNIRAIPEPSSALLLGSLGLLYLCRRRRN